MSAIFETRYPFIDAQIKALTGFFYFDFTRIVSVLEKTWFNTDQHRQASPNSFVRTDGQTIEKNSSHSSSSIVTSFPTGSPDLREKAGSHSSNRR